MTCSPLIRVAARTISTPFDFAQRTGDVGLVFDFEGAPEDESIIHT